MTTLSIEQFKKDGNIKKIDTVTTPETIDAGQSGSETLQDIRQIGSDIKSSTKQRVEKIAGIKTALKGGEQGNLRSIYQATGQVAGIGADAITSIVKGVVKSLLPQSAEEKVKSGIKEVATPIVESSPVQSLLDKYEELKKTNPALARDIDSTLGLADLALNLTGVGAGARPVAKTAGQIALKSADVTTNALKTGVQGIETVTKTGLPKLLSYTSDVPENAFKILTERTPQVTKAIKATTPEQALQNTRSAVRDLRTNLSKEWDTSVQNILKENEGVRTVFSDKIVGELNKISDEFSIELPQNLKSLSADEMVKLLKDINEIPRSILAFSPRGSLIRRVKSEIKDIATNTFGGKDGSFSKLYSNYSSKKKVLDAANDIVKAYSEGKPLTSVTAQNRLLKIFDENKNAYLDAISDLEKITGKDLLSDIAAQKFKRILPTKSVSGGVLENLLKYMLLPLTSPRGVMYIQKVLQKGAENTKGFVKNPKLGLSVQSISPETIAKKMDNTDADLIRAFLKKGNIENFSEAEPIIEAMGIKKLQLTPDEEVRFLNETLNEFNNLSEKALTKTKK